MHKVALQQQMFSFFTGFGKNLRRNCVGRWSRRWWIMYAIWDTWVTSAGTSRSPRRLTNRTHWTGRLDGVPAASSISTLVQLRSIQSWRGHARQSRATIHQVHVALCPITELRHHKPPALTNITYSHCVHYYSQRVTILLHSWRNSIFSYMSVYIRNFVCSTARIS